EHKSVAPLGELPVAVEKGREGLGQVVEGQGKGVEGGLVHHLRTDVSPQILDGSRFIGLNAGTEQVGDGDAHNNGDYGDYNHEFEQGKSTVSFHKPVSW